MIDNEDRKNHASGGDENTGATTKPPQADCIEPPPADLSTSPPVMGEPKGNPSAESSEAKQKVEPSRETLEDRIRKSDRWMILLTALAAIAAIVSAVIFSRQLTVMSRQLSAMRDQQKTMDTQTRIMLSQQRPWLTVVAIPEQSNATGFRFNPNGSATLFFKIKIKNVGQAVAEGIYTNTAVILISRDDAKDGDRENKKITTAQNDTCAVANLMGSDERKYGSSLFPGEERIEPGVAVIDAKEIKRATIQTTFGPAIHPIIVGCVDYHFFVSPDHHQTPFAFEATRNDWSEMILQRMIARGKTTETWEDTGYLILGKDVSPKHTSFERAHYGNSDVK